MLGVGQTFRHAWHVYRERGCSGLAFCQYDLILRMFQDLELRVVCVFFSVGWMKTLSILSLSPALSNLQNQFKTLHPNPHTPDTNSIT